MCYTSDNHNLYVSTRVQKNFLKIQALIKQFTDKNIKFFMILPPKFHIFTNIVIFQVFLQHF